MLFGNAVMRKKAFVNIFSWRKRGIDVRFCTDAACWHKKSSALFAFSSVSEGSGYFPASFCNFCWRLVRKNPSLFCFRQLPLSPQNKFRFIIQRVTASSAERYLDLWTPCYIKRRSRFFIHSVLWGSRPWNAVLASAWAEKQNGIIKSMAENDYFKFALYTKERNLTNFNSGKMLFRL